MRAGILCINSATLNANIALAYLAEKIPQAKELGALSAFRAAAANQHATLSTGIWRYLDASLL
jgi:hypothetical protein